MTHFDLLFDLISNFGQPLLSGCTKKQIGIFHVNKNGNLENKTRGDQNKWEI
jgi:hypothetical protein